MVSLRSAFDDHAVWRPEPHQFRRLARGRVGFDDLNGPIVFTSVGVDTLELLSRGGLACCLKVENRFHAGQYSIFRK